MKTRNLILLLLLISNLAARAVTKVYVQDITVTAGSEFEVPICLNTDLTDIDLIEGTIIFPSQMMVIDDAYGTNKRVRVDESRASGFMGNYNPDKNSFKLQSVSSPLTAGDGVIAYMTVRVFTDIPASSTISLGDFRIRHKTGEYEDISAVNGIVAGNPAPDAAIALKWEPAALELKPGDKGIVELQVSTTGNITGLQGVFTVGDDITITAVEKGSVAGSPTIFNYNPDNGTFVYFGSMDNVSGSLLSLEIEAGSTFSGRETVTLSGIVATDATSTRITHDDVTINIDDDFNVADVDYIIERIGEEVNETNKDADVNGDGEIDVADADYIIERIK